MKDLIKSLLVYLFDRTFHLDLDVADLPWLRSTLSTGVRPSPDELRALDKLHADGRELDFVDVGNLRVTREARIKFSEEHVEPLRLLRSSLAPESLECLRFLSDIPGVPARQPDAAILRLMEQIRVLAASNRLEEIFDLAAGFQIAYSQEGEAQILDRVFDFSDQGLYVDVGAHHPKRFSNTYTLYKRGWRGICIDPTPGLQIAYAELRPGDVFVPRAVSNVRSVQRFYMFAEAALNTFSAALATEYEASGHPVTATQDIEAVPLADILRAHVVDEPIRLMSIDVEDHEMQVLQSNDWQRFRPQVLVTEVLTFSLDRPRDFPVHAYLAELGYHLFAKTHNSLFYRDGS